MTCASHQDRPLTRDDWKRHCTWPAPPLCTLELVNNGVYRAGFATRQAAYEAAERDVRRRSRAAQRAGVRAGDGYSWGAVETTPHPPRPSRQRRAADRSATRAGRDETKRGVRRPLTRPGVVVAAPLAPRARRHHTTRNMRLRTANRHDQDPPNQNRVVRSVLEHERKDGKFSLHTVRRSSSLRRDEILK